MNDSIHFSIKYDGPALSTHQMDVRELAPALIALSSLLEEANRAIFNDTAEVRVNVHGNFKGGSFEVDLVALQGIKDQIISIFSGPTSTAAANLFAILGGIGLLGSGGLIGLVKWLKGRKPSSIRIEGDKTIFELKMSETLETFEVDLAAGRLYQSRVVRQALAKVVKPISLYTSPQSLQLAREPDASGEIKDALHTQPDGLDARLTIARSRKKAAQPGDQAHHLVERGRLVG